MAHFHPRFLRRILILKFAIRRQTGRRQHSPISYASLNNDAEALTKISELEAILSQKLGKDVALVAFSL